MIKILKVYRKTAKEAIDHLDEFVDAMEQFIENNPNHSYEASIKKTGNEWEVKVKVTKDEKHTDTITT